MRIVLDVRSTLFHRLITTSGQHAVSNLIQDCFLSHDGTCTFVERRFRFPFTRSLSSNKVRANTRVRMMMMTRTALSTLEDRHPHISDFMAKQLYEPSKSPSWVVVNADFECEVWLLLFSSLGLELRFFVEYWPPNNPVRDHTWRQRGYPPIQCAAYLDINVRDSCRRGFS